MLTETVLQRLPQAKLIVCSGMAGAGSANAITTSRRLNRFYLCGDGTADIAADGSLLAPRVSVCAAHAATMGHETGAGLHHTLNKRRILNYDARR